MFQTPQSLMTVVKSFFPKPKTHFIVVHASFQFEAEDPKENPTNAQLLKFLNLKKSNIILPSTEKMDSAKRKIKSSDIINPPHISWKESLVYELTGIDFGKVVPNTLKIIDGVVKLSFSVELEQLSEYFNLHKKRNTDIFIATKEALKDEMDVRSDSISQQVFFHYFTKRKTYATAVLSRARIICVEIKSF